MRITDLTAASLTHHLHSNGIALRTGPVVTRLRSHFPGVAEGLALLYADHELAEVDQFCDFDCEVMPPKSWRRWIRPQAMFSFDGLKLFAPLAGHQAFAMLEWGLNWCVSAHCHQYIIIHAAVIARDGRAMVLPAPPGSGKSTLCAGLVCRGWRLLSDELCLIDKITGEIVPLPRPVSLKNQSIDVIKRFAPDAVFGRTAHDTAKGSVAHMKAPQASVYLGEQRARLNWLVFPKYIANNPVRSEPMTPGAAFMALADNAFNFHLHGEAGFDLVSDLVADADTMRFEYGDLNEAVAFFDAMVAKKA